MTAAAAAQVTNDAQFLGVLDAMDVSATATAANRAIQGSVLGLLLSNVNAIVVDAGEADATLGPLMATASMVHVIPNRSEPAALLI
jgi:hypothetical protein